MKKKVQKETPKEKEKRIHQWRRMTYSWDKTDMMFCLQNNLSIYPACQQNGTLFLYAQQGERFKRLDDKVYRQDSEEECLEYTVAIILAYQEYAKKIRLKKNQ